MNPWEMDWSNQQSGASQPMPWEQDYSGAQQAPQQNTVNIDETGDRQLPGLWKVNIGGVQANAVLSQRPDGRRVYLVRTDDGGVAKVMRNKSDGSLSLAPYTDKESALGSNAENFFAGAGKAVVDTGRGIGQLLGQVDQKTVDEAKARDAELMHSKAGIAGNIAGHAAMYALPAGAIAKTATGGKAIAALTAIPKTAGLLPAALGGAAYAGLQPVATGESRALNMAAGFAGGAAGQRLANQAGAFASGVREGLTAGAARPSAEATAAAATQVVDDLVVKMGYDTKRVDPLVYDTLKKDVTKALKAGGNIDESALQRKAEFLNLNMQPTEALITRDPTQWTNEQALKGVAGVGDELANRFNNYPRQLINALQERGAAGAPDAFDAGQRAMTALKGFDDAASARQGELWRAARDMQGRPAELATWEFSRMVDDGLKQTNTNVFLPKEIKRMVNDFASGKAPLTVETAEQFKTILATEARNPNLSGNAKAAIGAVRDAIENTPLASEMGGSIGGPNGNIGREAIDAFNQARAATREYKSLLNKDNSRHVKALYDVVEGTASPDSFMKKHVLSQSATVDDVSKLAAILRQSDPESLAIIRSNVVDALKKAGTGGKIDELGVFSQAGYNKLLNSIGDRKLSALGFSRDEITQLRNIGKVASYVQVAPAGSAVNTSNTAANALNLLKKTWGVQNVVGNPFVVLQRKLDARAASKAASASVPMTMPSVASRKGFDPLAQAGGVSLLNYLGAQTQ